MSLIAIPVQAQALYFVVWLLSFFHSALQSLLELGNQVLKKKKIKVLTSLIFLLVSLPSRLNWVSFCAFHVKPVTNIETDLIALIKL